jgi:hypothetical protein
MEVNIDFYAVFAAKESRAANSVNIYAVVRVNRVDVLVNDVTCPI